MCKNVFNLLVSQIKTDGPNGSVILSRKIDEWKDHTRQCKENGTCPYLEINCIDCPVVCATLPVADRTHLERIYLT